MTLQLQYSRPHGPAYELDARVAVAVRKWPGKVLTGSCRVNEPVLSPHTVFTLCTGNCQPIKPSFISGSLCLKCSHLQSDSTLASLLSHQGELEAALNVLCGTDETRKEPNAEVRAALAQTFWILVSLNLCHGNLGWTS